MEKQGNEAASEFELVGIKKASVRGQIFDQIKHNIISGAWPPGTKIPSEKELARILGASRISIREALQKLAGLNLLETRHGAGSYVRQAGSDSTEGGDFLAFLALSRPGVYEIDQFRKIIEVGAIELAVPNADDADIAVLANLVRLMRDCEDDMEKHVAADLSFHAKIVELSGNTLLTKVYGGIRNMLAEAMRNILTDAGKRNAFKYHSLIVKDFEKRDVSSARRHLNEHFEIAMARILKDEQIERI